MEKAIQSISDLWKEYSLQIKVYSVIAAFIFLFVWPWTVGWFHIIF